MGDTTKLTVGFRDLANAPNKSRSQIKQRHRNQANMTPKQIRTNKTCNLPTHPMGQAIRLTSSDDQDLGQNTDRCQPKKWTQTSKLKTIPRVTAKTPSQAVALTSGTYVESRQHSLTFLPQAENRKSPRPLEPDNRNIAFLRFSADMRRESSTRSNRVLSIQITTCSFSGHTPKHAYLAISTIRFKRKKGAEKMANPTM